MKYIELKRLKESQQMSKKTLWTYDCETKDGLKGKLLYCWSLATNSNGKNNAVKVYSGKSMLSFFNTIEKLKEKTTQIIYVHNLQFDSRFIIDYCLRNNITYYDIYANSNLIILILPEFKMKFVDSFQFLLESQEKAEITYNVDIELRKIDCKEIFEKDFKKWSNLDKQLVIEHNKNDTLALRQIMLKFRKKIYEISNVDLLQTNTLASLSLKAFRKTLQQNILNCYITNHYDTISKKYFYQLNEEKYLFTKNSYYGGYTECLNHNIVKNVNYYDFVSRFPASMYEFDYPDGIPYWTTDKNEIESKLLTHLSIIEAKMIPNYSEKYPILPFRKNNRTIFGNFTEIGIWTNIEINYAIERNYSFEFIRALIFPSKFNPFKNFITKFFTIKQQNKGAIRQIAKIILNSSYGKFGQRIYQKSSVFKFFLNESEALEFYQDKIDNNINAQLEYNQIYEKYLVKFTEERKIIKPFQIVHLSSFVTAYSRIELLKKIHYLTDNNIIVYYCDTDSIVAEPNNIIKLGKNLGNFDIECSFKAFMGIAPKCYIAENIIKVDKIKKLKSKSKQHKFLLKVKGIRRNKINEIIATNDSIEKIYQKIKSEIILDEQYLPIKSSLIRFKSTLSSVITTKQMSLTNSKRLVLENKSTLPLSDKEISIILKEVNKNEKRIKSTNK